MSYGRPMVRLTCVCGRSHHGHRPEWSHYAWGIASVRRPGPGDVTASADQPHIGLVVEGPGDANAIPSLLRLWLHGQEDYRDILGKPLSCNGRDKALPAGGLEGYVAAAASRPGCRALIIILDGEGDRVCQLGPDLLARATRVGSLADARPGCDFFVTLSGLSHGRLSRGPCGGHDSGAVQRGYLQAPVASQVVVEFAVAVPPPGLP